MEEPAAAQEEAIEEIIVTSTRSRRSFATSPTRVEILGSEELAEKGNMKPGDIRMLLNESTGIHVQQTSATSFNSSIRIQGLDGKYTQLLRDGMPLYSGFSGSLSLLQIAPLDLQQVEVIKGANSTLYGAGAIAGLINLVSKTPGTDPENSMLVNATSAGGTDVSGFFTRRSEAVGATLFTSYNGSDAYDPADNGFSAIPEFERWTFNPSLFLYGNDSELRFAINAVAKDRLGGDMNYIDGDRTGPAYFEDGTTLRLSSLLEYSRQSGSGRELVLRNNISRFRREQTVPGFEFSGVQHSSFSEAHILGMANTVNWVAGLNLWTEEFEQEQALPPALLTIIAIILWVVLYKELCRCRPAGRWRPACVSITLPSMATFCFPEFRCYMTPALIPPYGSAADSVTSCPLYSPMIRKPCTSRV